MPYILEVQTVNTSGPMDCSECNGKNKHVGYMNKVFKSKQEMCHYYNIFNPHMKPLDAVDRVCSDYDPVSGLRYIVREHFYEYLHIPAFEEDM